MTKLKIATRGSQLALWQANHVKRCLEEDDPELSVELLVIKTKGDKILDVPLSKVGGKGLFVKEIEQALLDKDADLAVHSMKDMPAVLEKGLTMAAVSKRAEPWDAWVSKKAPLMSLPAGAVVGTSSLRRACQLKEIRPDLIIESLRGNVPTRVRKLEEGKYDGIVLAKAGLVRLGLENHVLETFGLETMIPAVGQGALGLEIREEHEELGDRMKRVLHHDADAACVEAERSFLLKLEGGCQAPIAAYASIAAGRLNMIGLVGETDGSVMYRDSHEGAVENAYAIGVELAEKLLSQGADKIIKKLMH